MSYLDTGIYTIPAAARLLSVSEARVRGWVSGHHHSGSPALVKNEISIVGHRVAISFKNLIEALLISRFSKYISIQGLRQMALVAREEIDDDHPFATKHIEFSTDKKSVFAKIVRAGIEHTLNLRTRNLALGEIMRPFLIGAVEYGDLHANLWHPRPKQSPNVYITPAVAFGQPVIHNVPTRALFDAVKAEDGDYKTVARWYELPVSAVKEAHRFQKRLTVN